MESVDLDKMDEAAFDKWYAEQERERFRQIRAGEVEPERIDLDVLEEYIEIDIRGKGEVVDDYWSRGWTTGLAAASRSNCDETGERCVKSFPTRYRLDDLVLSKSLRRVIKRSEGLARVIRPMRVTPAKEKLNAHFDADRFGYLSQRQLSNKYGNTRYYPSRLMETCVFQGDILLACSIFQIGKHAAFGDTAMYRLGYESGSLGILTVLMEMLYAKELGKKHYYLAGYSKYNPLYQYKTRFPGLELYDWDHETWIDFKDERVEAMLEERLPLKPEVTGEI